MTVLTILAVSVSSKMDDDEILNYNEIDHKHVQVGQAGQAVKGSYR